ncbi:MAG: AAA family ATPase [Peptococcaceae bacterium]|jgi:stage V sporulation protein K|nr:AAA family ATPase [Peptococcaceae bacterium]MDH7524142.1 AAA family ATPase [Peptococcaceae bacterium]
MAIRYSFNHQKNNEPPVLVVNKPPYPAPRLSELQVFKWEHEPQNNGRRGKIEEILQELDSLVGLVSVKKLILEIRAYVEIQKRREKESLICEPMVLHMVFKGNPGTGKTTVARILGRLFKELGVLEKGHVVEVERADLVGEYIGHTAHKTREQIKKALGGVLFIDEAYSLARGGERDFGKESIDTLVKNMEEYKENLILILAGYKHEMNWFLETNPGLRSRFPIFIDFPDYTVQELLDIAQIMLAKRQYQFTEEAKLELEKHLNSALLTRHEHSGNARLVRNIIEKAIRQQALRLVGENSVSRQELITITASDLSKALL